MLPECLNENLLLSFVDAREEIEEWRTYYSGE